MLGFVKNLLQLFLYGQPTPLHIVISITFIFNHRTIELQTLIDNVSDEDDYRSNTFGKFYLEGGNDEIANIKNKNYKIEIINVYNNKKESFLITPKAETTQVDENKFIEDQSQKW